MDSINRLTGASSGAIHPRGITELGAGGKFTPYGDALPYQGNTFICRLDSNSDAHYALTKLQEGIKTGPAAKYFAYVPTASFHMTIFQGACSSPLEKDNSWPKGFKKTTSVDKITESFHRQLREVDSFDHVTVKPVRLWDGHWLPVIGADTKSTRKLWAARNTLQEYTRIYRSDFLDYHFHITIVYQTRWMPQSISAAHLNHSKNLFKRFEKDVEVIKFNQIELCSYRDMLNYETIDFVSCSKPPYLLDK